MKAVEYIEQESFVIGNPSCPIIKKEDALKAVEMAREEILESIGKNALACIQERKRQIEVEGFDVHKDECYKGGQLSLAASAYAMPNYVRKLSSYWNGKEEIIISNLWPRDWYPEMWKPAKDNSIAERKRELVKAGALILAEMDRLDRLEEKQ